MRRARGSRLRRRPSALKHFFLAFILVTGVATFAAAQELGAEQPIARASPVAWQPEPTGSQHENVPDSDTEHPAHLEFTWIDGYQLPEGCQREAAHEVRRLFMREGIEVDWELPGIDADPHESPDVQVILMDAEPEDWGLQHGTLATALNNHGGEPNPHVVFVFMPNVLDAMTGIPQPTAVEDAVGLGTVLGRLIAETTVQAAHAWEGEFGLVTPVVSWAKLTDPNCCLDYAASRSLWFLLLMQ